MTLRSVGARAGSVLAFAISLSPMTAAGADGPATSGAEVVVTANRIPTEIDKIGSSISVITAQDLEHQQTRFITDILQTTPGLTVSQSGPRGAATSVKLRGQNPEGTLVLIDGVEVSDPSQVKTQFDFAELLAGQIERIEVLRGSQSVLYGSDAVGGVINIITKRGMGPLGGSLYAEGGSYGTYLFGGRALGGALNGRLGYNVDLQYLGSTGFSAADKHLPGNKETDGYRNLSSAGRFDLGVSDAVDLKAVYRVTTGTSNFDACGGPFCDARALGEDFLQYSGRLSSEFRLLDDRFTGQLGLAYDRNARDGFDHSAPFYYYRGDRTKLDFQGAYAINGNNTLVFGAETKEDRMRTDGNPVRISARNSGFYALYQLGLFEALYLSAGARIDKHETFGAHETYRATVAYDIARTGTKLKASYSTGFRAPSLFELFGACCGDPLLGNRDLGPEKSKSWDAGVEQKLWGDRLKLEAVYFEIKTDNKIDFGGIFGGQGPNYFNVAGVTTSTGVETRLTWAPLAGLSAEISYTYNQVKDEAGARLQNRPRHAANVNLNYDFWRGRANLNFNARYNADTLDSDFSTFPAKVVKLDDPLVLTLGARINIFKKTELSARIENLLDTQYQTEFGYGTAGRSVFVGLKQRL